MDLREIVRAHPSLVVGHSPVARSLNLRNEIRRFSTDPLATYVASILDAEAHYFLGDTGRYLQGFRWYSLCLRRALEHCSVARRWHSALRWHPPACKYSARQKVIATKQKTIGLYQELDYQNLIIHACILLDRTVTFSRRFLNAGNLPSFTSFSKHKDFLKKHPDALGQAHREYVGYITTQTDWFEIPLKLLRDKYLMHSAEKHISSFGWSGSANWDLEMITMQRPQRLNHRVSMAPGKWIVFTPRRLARDVEDLLKWFAAYALGKTDGSPVSASTNPNQTREHS